MPAWCAKFTVVCLVPFLARSSASQFPEISLCKGTQTTVITHTDDSLLKIKVHSTSSETGIEYSILAYPVGPNNGRL